MCAMCNGATHEELLADLHRLIGQHGFTVAGVEPDLDHPTWLYTIGLLEHHDHPELSILGVPLGFGIAALNSWGRYVIDGHRLADGETGQLAGMQFSDDQVSVDGDVVFHFEDVDDRLWSGDMFNQWHQYYLWRGIRAPSPSAVELYLCGSQPDPFLPAARRPNRVARRAQTRRHRH